MRYAGVLISLAVLIFAGCAIPYPTYPFKFRASFTGGSMMPTFPYSGTVEITRVSYDSLLQGFVVAVSNPFNTGGGDFTIHRLLRRQGDDWVTKGDNNETPDRGLMTRANYIGIAELVQS